MTSWTCFFSLEVLMDQMYLLLVPSAVLYDHILVCCIDAEHVAFVWALDVQNVGGPL